MCLAIPGKVVELHEKGKKAVVEQPGVKREVLNAINAKLGDFVLVQQGFIVEKLSQAEAEESWTCLE